MSTSQNSSIQSRILAVFPGQGSQHVGMAKDLFENFARVREIFEEASDAIHLNIKKLCFEGPENDLALTENTQPCLLTASLAAFRVAENELGFAPHVVAGHSLGEYTALVAANCLNFSTAIRWVKERGAAMQKAVPAGEGKMAAILGLDDLQIESLCKKATELAQSHRLQGENSDLTIPALVQPANYNAPGQVVIAGSRDALEDAISLLKSDEQFSKGKAIPLQVSAPFHCKLMNSARNRMAELFSSAPLSQKPNLPKWPYVPNRTGRSTQEPGLVFELLIEQVDHPVLWKQSIQNLFKDSLQTCIEFGPGKVLSGLTKRIAHQESKDCNLLSVSDRASLGILEKYWKQTNSH